MKQTIICTAIPDGVQTWANSNRLKLSLRISPQLTADNATGSLGDFADFSCQDPAYSEKNWAGHKISFTVQFGTGNPGHIHWSSDHCFEAQFQDERDPAVWARLFPATTLVRSYAFKDFTNCRIRSFPVKEILGYIQDLYQKTGLASPGEMPSITYRNHYQYAPLLESRLSAVSQRNDASLTKGWQHGPYPKSGNPNLDFYQSWKFHQFKGGSLQEKIEKKEYDFHERITLFENYDLVMRRLGLVYDIECNLPAIGGIPTGGPLWVRVLPKWNFAANVVVNTPGTACQLDLAKKCFSPASRPGSEIKNGMLDLASSDYGLMQIDVDGAALKLIDFAKALEYLLENKDKSIDPPQRTGLPAIRTGGLALFRNQRAATTYEKIQASSTFHSSLMSDPDTTIALYADDLVRGYRVDILDVGHATTWRSLCQRQERYYYNDGTALNPLPINQEGTVTSTMNRDANAPDDLYQHESLFHWDGWGLAVRRPGNKVTHEVEGTTNTIETGDSTYGVAGGAESDPDGALRVEFLPVAKSLPRLRFGRIYRLRVRVVDLAGKSKQLTPDVDLTCASEEVGFFRFEPVSSPALVADKKFDDAAPGESLERLVIHNTQPTVSSVRNVAPPRTSQQMAEMHGMFDGQCPYPESWYSVLKKRHGGVELDDDGNVAKNPYLPEVSESPLNDVPYLPDPAVAGVAVRGFPKASDLRLIDFGTDVPWPSARPFRIALASGPARELLWNENERILTLRLPAAEMADVRISCYLRSEKDLFLFGVWKWLADAAQDERRGKLQQLAMDGGHWMISPYRELKLVHAVQKPLREPDLGQVHLKRKIGETFVTFDGPVQVDGKSTGKVDIHAQWTDYYDRQKTEQQGHPFDILSDDPSNNVLISTGKRHEFGDTRYRKVTYTAVATSRFREYFAKDTDLTGEGASVTLHALNSARPPAPAVEYVLPTFSWHQDEDIDGEIIETTKKRTGGLRIYLQPPWYTSGEGELLGVVIAHGPPVNASHPGLPKALANFVTQWGTDPVWLSGPTYLVPSIHHFSGTVAEETGVTLKEVATLPAEHDSWYLSVVGYPVAFDEQNNLWYADIDIDAGPSYFPFIRLALARYQPKSVYGAQLSSVSLADFIQLTPERTAWVRTCPDQPQAVQISVSGIAPWKLNKDTLANIMVVRAEMHHPDKDAWLPVSPTWLPLIRTQITAPFTVWSGIVPLPLPRDEARFRLIIEEYEIRDDDDAYRGEMELLIHTELGQRRVGKRERLVYADTLEI